MRMRAWLSIALFASAVVADEPGARFRGLDGSPLEQGNAVDPSGHIRVFARPVVRIHRAPAATVKGCILVLPGGGYKVLAADKEGSDTALFLNQQGYDAAVLEYPIDQGPGTRDHALRDAMSAFRALRADPARFGLRGGRFGLLGYSAGGHLAARTTAMLTPEERPDDLMLIYPAYLQERKSGTDRPAVEPPDAPHGRLFVLIARNDQAQWVQSSEVYVAAWRTRKGEAVWHLLPDGGHGFGMAPDRKGAAIGWPEHLAAFLAKP